MFEFIGSLTSGTWRKGWSQLCDQVITTLQQYTRSQEENETLLANTELSTGMRLCLLQVKIFTIKIPVESSVSSTYLSLYIATKPITTAKPAARSSA